MAAPMASLWHPYGIPLAIPSEILKESLTSLRQSMQSLGQSMKSLWVLWLPKEFLIASPYRLHCVIPMTSLWAPLWHPMAMTFIEDALKESQKYLRQCMSSLRKSVNSLRGPMNP